MFTPRTLQNAPGSDWFKCQDRNGPEAPGHSSAAARPGTSLWTAST